jgi:O-antigen/teichoic acid export membrane protein
MKNLGNYFFTKTGYLYSWRIIELITIILVARLLDINEFSIGFFAVITAYFLMSLFDITMEEKDSSKIRKYCNTLSMIYPLFGVFAAVIIFIISLLYPFGFPLRLASIIALFISFKKTPEVFYKGRKRHEKIFSINMISQIISSILLIILIYFDLKELSIIISYIVYNVLTTLLLWSFFPFKIKSQFNKESYLNILDSLKSNFRVKTTRKIIAYLPLIVVGFFNIEYFAYIYLSFIIGYFLYRNLTLFITSLFSDKFVSMNRDLFRYNLVKVTEYLSFIILPLSFLNVVLVPQISSILVKWQGFPEILLMMLFAGLIKSIVEISRLVFLAEPKKTAIIRLSIIEIFSLLLFMALFGWIFGAYGIALAILVSVVFSSAITLLIVQRFIKIDLLTVSKNFLYIIISALLSSLSVGFLKEWFNVVNVFSLFLIYMIGILLYLFLTFIINKGFYRIFIRFVFEVLEE